MFTHLFHNIPKCKYVMSEDQSLEHCPDGKTIYTIDELSGVHELCERLVEADCWALVTKVGKEREEIIYNGYKTKSIKKILSENTIRHQLGENIHQLFVYFHRCKLADSWLDIYMFQEKSWKVRITFSPSQETFTVAMYTSVL